MLLRETPAVLSLVKLCEEHGYTSLEKLSKIHMSSNMARELIARHQILYHLWFLEFQRVLPQLRLQLSRRHRHHRSQHRLTEIQYRRTEVWKLQYQKEVGGTSEELRGESLHESTETENQNKNMESKEVQRDISHELPD